jgi:hypothetical protein
MGGISRRGLFAGLFAAPLAVAAGMPLADKLNWLAWVRQHMLGIMPTINVTIDETDGTVSTWETTGVEAWQKWQAAHPFGRYKTAEGQIIGRAKHALIEREIMREHGLPEYQEDSLMPYMKKALEDAKIYVFEPEPSYGERIAREYYEW